MKALVKAQAAEGIWLQDVPEPEYWTEDRIRRVLGASLVALIGSFYLFFSSGAYRALRGKRPSLEDADEQDHA